MSVVIKSNKYGITLVLDRETPFPELLAQIGEKFRASARFFKGAQMVLGFEGRILSQDEQMQVLRAIEENSGPEILCVMEQDALKESFIRRALEERQAGQAASDGRFYKGTLRSGQVLESETSIIILGDVNPGATVASKGNVVILGTLKGTVHAGAAGNDSAFVAALNMDPMQIRIADCIARSGDGQKSMASSEPMIAYTENGNIYMEPITKEAINDIRI